MSVPSPADDQLKRALRALTDMRQRLEAVQREKTEPIAIIGIGCRFPGGADSAEAFWASLRDGIDAVTEIPADRWDVDALYDRDAQAAGKVATRWGGFLKDIDAFDASFFGISPREAARMDPQQRLLLEVAWEALADAGLAPSDLAGKSAGVFVGVHSHSMDYWTLQAEDAGTIEGYSGTGTSHSVLAGRLSYLLDLRGPSLAIDTACSSSLVAVHLACQSLRARECSVALVGGVNLILSPEFTMAASRLQMMAADGRCKAFDARADGFVRGEGCGVVVLKRLSDAQASRDRVRAVIRGSAVNQDGRSNGLTAPSGQAQEALIRTALDNSGVSAAELTYIEAHGTGTPLGDPIEIEALGHVIGPRPDGPECVLGSVKTNVGHLEGAAGVAGLIKTVLALQHGVIPPLLHFQALNPHISLRNTPFVIPVAPRPWPRTQRRYAGVSSFGWSGTNAHVVLEEAPEVDRSRARTPPASLLPVSAHTPQALRVLARAYRDLLSSTSSSTPELADVAYTSAVRRTHHRHRLAVTARSREEAVTALDAFMGGAAHPMVATGIDPSRRRRVVFVFPGQGSQWTGMGCQLLEQEPVFRAALERCDAAVRREVGWSVIATLRSELSGIDVIQPVLFSMQVALAELWRAWGIDPDAVIGHSMGEVAAAHVAGALGLDDAVRVICRRSRLLRELSGQGAMAAVDLSWREAQAVIVGYEDRVSVAVSNGRRSTVLSGDPGALDKILVDLKARNVFCRRINVDVASHSPQVEALEPELQRALSDVAPAAARLPIYSTVTGDPVDGGVLDAGYWIRNVRQPVLFGAAVERSQRDGFDVFLEVSPHPILLPAIAASAPESDRLVALVPSLRRTEDEAVSLRTSAGQLYAAGVALDWARLQPTDAHCVTLPAYPWQRERFWLDPPHETSLDRRVLRRQRVDLELERWRYEVAWRPRPVRALTTTPSAWTILADSGGVGAALAGRLRESGARVLVVRPGKDYERSSAGDLTIRPDRQEDFDRLLGETGQGSGVHRLVHLWGLDGDVAEGDDLARIREAVARGTRSALALLQAAVRARRTELRTWLVTRGAQALVEAAPAAVGQAPLWGLGMVTSLDHPEVWGGLVDLDPATDADDVGALTEALLSDDGEDRVALRRGERYVARLGRVPAATEGAVRLQPHATYLITGGLGGLGLRLARWAIERGARHLVLAGRRGATEAAGPALQELERAGAEVVVVSADVGRVEDVEAILASIRERSLPPLAGVFHVAGVVDDGLLERQDWSRVERVMRAKVDGAWNLHRLTTGLGLEHFVLFSSAVSVVGTPAQAGYAAANAFLDALAHHRRRRGLPALSVNWGRWGEVGLAADDQRARNLDALGFAAMAPDAALEALGRAMREDRPQIAVMAFDAETYAARFPGRERPLLAELRTPAEPASPAIASAVLARLRAAAPEERERLLVDHVRALVAAIMRFEDPQALDPAQGFFNLGMDSLMAMELKNRLQASLQCSLVSTVVFDAPTMLLLARVLDRQLFGAAPAGTVAEAGGEAVTDLADLPDLAPDALQRMLADELRQVKALEDRSRG